MELGLTVLALQVALPSVAEADRFQVHKLGVRGVYHVICRHGFTEAPKPDDAFVHSMVRKICAHVRYQAMTARYMQQGWQLHACLHVCIPLLPSSGSESGVQPLQNGFLRSPKSLKQLCLYTALLALQMTKI